MMVRCRKCGCTFDVLIPRTLKVYEAILKFKSQFAKNADMIAKSDEVTVAAEPVAPAALEAPAEEAVIVPDPPPALSSLRDQPQPASHGQTSDDSPARRLKEERPPFPEFFRRLPVQEDIPMVINCIQCNIDYRLDGVFLQEVKKGVRMRCHECGCTFDALIITPILQDGEAIPQFELQFANDPSI